jgi:hypothetical protein
LLKRVVEGVYDIGCAHVLALGADVAVSAVAGQDRGSRDSEDGDAETHFDVVPHGCSEKMLSGVKKSTQ